MYLMYRVINKEGHKVYAYNTTKICIFGATQGFILTTTLRPQLWGKMSWQDTIRGVKVGLMGLFQVKKDDINKNTPFQSVMDFRVIHIKSKIPKTSQHFIETKVFLNFFLSDIFKNLDVGNQMSRSYSQNEPLSCPNNAYFSCIIGIYFVALNITLYIIFKKIYKLNSQFN